MKEHEETRDKIVPIDIEREMKKSYIDYAMSVIVGRALPDVRDGLKPVHRRILYAMNELGMTPDKPYRKSARIVGDVLGKYHPHGDSAVYDTIVRMAQDFKYRYMLADGHGNFGSIDGDGAAAMRYTEVRMSKIAMELLADINKNTVDFVPNFDGELKEPSVLPARFPHLLVNGTDGIAVGMATSIPPHHLGEVIDGVVKMIDNRVVEERETDIEELIDIIKAPDFPTGATIYGVAGINQAYRTGRGKVVIRAKAEIEDMGNKQRIIVTEIPFQVNKARLVEKIAELVKEKKIEGISDLRDESNRHGIRIVIELKRDANAHVLLNQLYKYTQMQESIGITMLALVNNQPKILNLKQILEHYIDHQKEVITRRTQFELDKAAARAHILEGLRIALDHIDEVIRLIRGARTTQEAKEGLINTFALTEKQAQAIVDMRLRSLTGLEREKIEEEFKELMKKIEYYRSILGDENLLYGVIREEILSIKEKYTDERRTEIVHAGGDIDIEDLIDEEQTVITMSHFGYIKRQPIDTYKAQNRGGKGIIAMQTREEDFVEDVFISSTHSELLFFTNLGKVYSLKAYHVPEASRQAKGTAIVNLLQLQPEEKISAIIPIRNFEDGAYLFMVTKQGLIKKTELKAYANIRKGGMIGICLRDEDQLVEVRMTKGDQDFIIATRKGMAIRFNEKDARPLGRTAMGVKGITLESKDYVIAMAPCREDASILTVCENGLGKRTPLEEYSTQNRGGKGVKNYKLSDKTGDVIAMKAIRENDDIVLVTSEGVLIRLRANEISKMGRATQGVKLINVAEDIKVVSLARIADAAEDTEENEKFEENE